MAKARAIIKRRKAVQNIHKITRTMQLIATARFQRTFQRMSNGRPYVRQIAAMAAKLAAGGEMEHALLAEADQERRVALLLITSNRGLCGGYNTALLGKTRAFMRQRRLEEVKIDLAVVGKKGQAYMRFAREPMEQEYHLPDGPGYQQIEPIAQEYINRFVDGNIDAVYVIYSRFYSSSRQVPEALKLLPASGGLDRPGESQSPQESEQQYEFTPQADQLLAQLLPEVVKAQLFQCFNEAAASEQVTRMVAMKAATDNAEDMIKSLTRQANRARQSQITRELTELMAGSEALT